VKTKSVMSRLSTSVFPSKRFVSSGPRAAEAVFYVLAGAVLLAWAIALVVDLAPKFFSALNLQAALLHNSGSSALLLALVIISAVAFYGAIAALRSRSLPPPSASILLITVAALRTLEILTNADVTIADANLLGALFLAAAVLYYGPTRLWWFLLMPLAIVASFSPLVWLEFYKGASQATLVQALWIPGAAFVAGSLLIVLRELRARAVTNVTSVEVLRLRSEKTIAALRSMESELKTLRSTLSQAAPPSENAFEVENVTPLETTEFSLALKTEPSEACSVDEIDVAARRLLDEARAAVQGRPVKLSLTAPVGVGLPIAVRGSVSTVTAWMKSAILNSIESLGGFPDGTVRVSIRPGTSTLQILIEDNGRGIGESAQAKMGQAAERVSVVDMRAGVERLGGRFEIQARLGVGARLSIELPRVDAFANSPRVAAARGLPAAAPSPESHALH
jgi:hypothetical protein